ncbi:MAG: poly-beta-1,6-N-acetyl-D-glucosamine N-deacetylase PgaB, partial [Casimicrobium sp.]
MKPLHQWLLWIGFVFNLIVGHAHAQTQTREPQSDRAFYVLSYHDVYASLGEAASVDSLSVSVNDLVRHFSWLRDNGYRVVSVDEVLAAKRGGKPLPERAVMLTFDDGYASFYRHVFPLLKLFEYPAVIAIVGGWIESPTTSTIEFESDRTGGAQFMTWPHIREVAQSGWVEVASHTYNLHYGIVANSQGNLQPAVITREFDRVNLRYESDEQYAARLRADLELSSSVIEARTGRRPRAIVWPYGAYNKTSNDIAASIGMNVGFTLDVGGNAPTQSMASLRRALVRRGGT